MPQPSGNRCGHNPYSPRLNAAVPIPKGKGGFPRILSLAAERAKAWYFHPAKFPALHGTGRKVRSERREACQIVLEVIFRHLDLASMCLGTPTPASGFINIDMRTIVRDSGIGQRRCERAIALLKEAGFMRVKQPRPRTRKAHTSAAGLSELLRKLFSRPWDSAKCCIGSGRELRSGCAAKRRK